jgi:NAD(P)-dependent dehydrogenase (short-subunit alcohol dehydrogenase family)
MAPSVAANERRVAFITGAGGGVGAACARRFAPTHRLLLTDANAATLEATATALRAAGDHDVQAEPGDLTDRGVVDALAGRAAADGPLGVVVHAAGLSPSMSDAWRILDVNLFGTINVLDALLPQVQPGSVGICIASIAGWRRGLWRFDQLLGDPLSPDFRRRMSEETGIDGHPGRGYALSKRAVILLAERRAHEWGACGGRLVSVSPGLIIDTAMGQLEAPKGASGLLAASSLKRNASSDDIAGACAMLASPDAAYVTGVDLRVDGGSIAGFWHHSDPKTAAAWDDPAY